MRGTMNIKFSQYSINGWKKYSTVQKDSFSYELRLKVVLSDLIRLHENSRIVILHTSSKIRRSRLLH